VATIAMFCDISPTKWAVNSPILHSGFRPDEEMVDQSFALIEGNTDIIQSST